jgi:hypothetical protein
MEPTRLICTGFDPVTVSITISFSKFQISGLDLEPKCHQHFDSIERLFSLFNLTLTSANRRDVNLEFSHDCRHV